MNQRLLYENILDIARSAGDVIMMEYSNQLSQIEYKVDSSPVTKADMLAHTLLVEGLKGVIPNCPVVSEEDERSWSYLASQRRYWLIDPLDGTKEFISKTGDFTVNIALIEEGRSVFGVVYAPATDTLYWGGARYGAFCRHKSQTVPIHANVKCGLHPYRVLSSRNHLNSETSIFINKLEKFELLQIGSSLKFCYIAEGKADIYPRLAPTSKWDTAAAQAVLEGAGGCVLDLQGLPLQYNSKGVLNPFFVAASDVSVACLV